jgi:hypothetical protein
MQDAPEPEDVNFPQRPTGRGGEEGCARDPADVERGGRAVDFADAEAVVSGSLGDEGTDAWTPVEFSRRRDLEIGVLTKWVEENGLWIPVELKLQIEPGRTEHNLIYIGIPPKRVMKFTKGQRFGFVPFVDPTLVSGLVSDWFPLRPATPLQYLRRMSLMHELFPALDHRLEGFTMLDGQFRIVISQQFINPVEASEQAIADFFTEPGFERLLPEAWYRAADNVAIFDTGTTNLLEFEGHLFPIDVMPIRPSGTMLERIQAALKVPFGPP